MENVLPEQIAGYTSAPPPGAGGPPPAPGVARLQPAGWWRRVGATLIDGVVIAVLAGVLLWALFAGVSASLDDGLGWYVGAFFAVLLCAVCAFVAAVAYAVVMSARTNGHTLGRIAFGIHVARTDGEPMGFKRAFVREAVLKWGLFYVLGGVLTLGILPLIDFLWPLWDQGNGALHDFVVITRVIKT